MVIDGIADASDGSKLQTMGLCQPLMARFLITAIHTIIVTDTDTRLHTLAQLTVPVKTIKRRHLVLLYFLIGKNVQYQFFTERSLIL
jgi:hypothetical protein